jgi:hypothetical protein
MSAVIPYSPICPLGMDKGNLSFPFKGKGKAIPLQTLIGPEGSRRSRLPDFKKIGT